MTLDQWASLWGVSELALDHLRSLFTAVQDQPTSAPGTTPESEVVQQVRLEAGEKGVRLWRNNVGAGQDATGRFIRYGLANDSKAINSIVKSSDLIGIRPVAIGSGLVGQFVARECKRPGWKFTGTKAEIAQLNFLKLVAGLGGDAAFATGKGTL